MKKIFPIFFMLIFLCFCSMLAVNINYNNKVAFVKATVLKTESVIVKNGDTIENKYLVFCDSETFELTDSLWYGKFNSSDTYGRLQVGKTYTFKVVGWRNHVLSVYRNIIEVGE